MFMAHQRYPIFAIDASTLFLPLPIPEYHKLSGVLWPWSIPWLEINMVLRGLHCLSCSYGSERQDWRETARRDGGRSVIDDLGWPTTIWHQVLGAKWLSASLSIKLHNENKPAITHRRPSLLGDMEEMKLENFQMPCSSLSIAPSSFGTPTVSHHRVY